MKTIVRMFVASTLIWTAGLLPATAQKYPQRPVKIIVPFPAGGATDVITRAIGERVAKLLGQPWIIENRPGANGAIGLSSCATSAPDGYTFCLLTADQLTIMPFYNPDLFNRYSTLVPTTLLVRAPGIIYAGNHVKARDMKEFAQLETSARGSLNYASFGVGSPPQIFFEWLNKSHNLSIQHIPFKGSNDALSEIISGRVDASYVALGFIVEQIKAGTLKGLAVLGDRRAPLLPEVPTLAELGFEYPLKGTWFGLGAPNGTSQEIMDVIAAAIRATVHASDFREKFLDPSGYTPVGSSSAEFVEVVRVETVRGKEIIDITGLKAQP